MTTREELQEMFAGKGDDFWDVFFLKNEGSFFRGTNYSGVCCTGFAYRVQQKLGKDRVKVMGFDSRTNPDALILSIADGHDFAVVDGKFIVDQWIAEIESGRITSPTGNVTDLKGQIAFSIHEENYYLVRTLYGEMKNWQEVFCESFEEWRD